MNRLQSLRADRELCVTLNRTAAIDPEHGDPDDRLRAPRLHRRRPGGAGAATTEISGRNRTHYCGAYWGWGFHEDGVAQRAARRRARSGRAAVTRERDLRGRRSATAASRVRRASSATGSRWPTSTSTSCRGCSAAGSSRAAPGLVRFRRERLPRRPGVPLADAVRDARRRAHRAARRTGRSGCSRTCARSATASTRSAFYYCFDARRRAARGRRRRGHEHAVGRAPRLRAPARRDPCAAASTRRCTSRRSWAWTSATRGARRRPGATLSVHIESSEDGARVFDATLGAAPRRRSTRRSLARVTARYPAATLRMLALIYGHALALKLRGVPASTRIRGSAAVVIDRAAIVHAVLRGSRAGRADRGRGRRATLVFGSGAPQRDRARPLAARAWRGAAAARQPRARGVLRRRAAGTRPTSPRSSASRRATSRRSTPCARPAVAFARVPLQRARSRARAQHAARAAARDIAAHYDLGNDLFARMLDPTMMYSCAVFEHRRRDARAGVDREARAGLREARPRPGRPRRSRSAPAGAASPSTPRRRAAAA